MLSGISMSIELERDVLNSLDVAVCAIDRDLRVTTCNRTWDALMHTLQREDLQASQIIGQPFLNGLADDERIRWATVCARLLDGEELSYWGEMSWPVGNSRRWLALTARTLFNADEQTIGLSFTLTDITERKRAEEEMARRRVELRGLFEVAQSAGLVNDEVELFRRVTGHLGYLFGSRICVIALRDEDTHAVVTRAPAHGLGADEVKEFVLPMSLFADGSLPRPGVKLPSYELYNRIDRVEGDCRIFAKRWNIGSLLSAPLRNHGRLLGYLVLADAANKFTDDEGRLLATFAGLVSAAVDANQLVLALEDRADKLSAALAEIQDLARVKDGLIQNVSHELRLPLMVIQGYADLMRDGAFGQLDAELQQAVETISDKSTQLAKRVDDIMLLRGLQQGDLQLNPVSLSALARSALERARARTGLTGVTFIDDIAADMSPVVVDYRRMEQVIDELLDNAIKFSPNGGEVRVTVREGGDVAYVKVADQGIGIPPDQLPRIWDRFYQSDPSTTRRFGGTGVGLAVVKQIVEAHGGQVWAESQVDAGSQFYVALRRARPAETAGEQYAAR
ncbi:MAG: ATP-binding protein [Anaerolineae bacterium]